MPNHYGGDLLPTMAISGLSRVRTELFQLAVVPALTPHPVQMHRQLAGHRHLGDLPSTPQGQVEEPAAPFGLAAHRHLRRFHQQITKQGVALFADVAQSPTIAAGLFCGNQTHIAGDLFAAVKAFQLASWSMSLTSKDRIVSQYLSILDLPSSWLAKLCCSCCRCCSSGKVWPNRQQGCFLGNLTRC